MSPFADVSLPADAIHRVLVIAAAAAAFTFLALGVGIFFYVAGSYAFALAHLERRPWRATIREVFRELFWAGLTQPLLPLHYLVGRRFARGSGTPVVFVHGYAQNRVSFVGLARELAKRGIGPLYGFNYPWMASVEGNAKRLAAFVASVRAETGAREVDVVAHSMGGLVALAYLVAEGPSAPVRRCVTIATPHSGVVWRGPILGRSGADLRKGSALLERLVAERVHVRLLSVYSSHDNVVHPPTTSSVVARGGIDEVVEGLGHLAILFDPKVVDAVARFLSEEKSSAEPEVDVVEVASPVSENVPGT